MKKSCTFSLFTLLLLAPFAHAEQCGKFGCDDIRYSFKACGRVSCETDFSSCSIQAQEKDVFVITQDTESFKSKKAGEGIAMKMILPFDGNFVCVTGSLPSYAVPLFRLRSFTHNYDVSFLVSVEEGDAGRLHDTTIVDRNPPEATPDSGFGHM